MISQETPLDFCKKCTHRKMNLEIGLLCGLTNEKANFTGECPDFNLDEQAEMRINTISVSNEDQVVRLSTEEFEQMKSEQNLPFGIFISLLAGVFGAIIWAAITVATEYQIGFVAIIVGAIAGLSMRYAGKGLDTVFGIAGATIAIFSCLLGNFFSIIGFVANYEGLGIFETILLFDYSQLIPIVMETFSPMDLVFYGIAGYEGFKFSFRTITKES